MTCFESGVLNSPQGLLVATLVGFAFGFWLERAGFGSSRKLTAIFYFRDFAVLKVLFTAIVTAAAGLFLLQVSGAVQAESIYRPATFLWPQVVGGLLFGAGFVVGGWCPGTALVGLSSGKLDALIFLVGATAGSIVYGFGYPLIKEFANSSGYGVSSLPEVLGFGAGVVTLAVAIVALVAFVAAERVEKVRGTRTEEEA